MEEVNFQIEEWHWTISYKAEESHRLTDKIVSFASTATARLFNLLGGSEPKTKLLTPGAEVGVEEVQEWSKFLQTQKGKQGFKLDQSWLHRYASEKLAEKGSAEEVANAAAKILKDSFKEAPEEGLLFVPLTIGGQGWFEPYHIVWVTADLQMKRVEHYDSKGIVLETDEDGFVRANKDATHWLVAGVIAALLRVSGFKKVRQNPFCHQKKDIHNCGVFGMIYMDKRRNEPFVKFIQREHFDLANERKRMVNLLSDSSA